MSAIITNSFRLLQTIAFRELFNPGSGNAMYIAIGKQTTWNASDAPVTPVDSFPQLMADYRDILSLKKAGYTDTTLVCPLVTWTAGTRYDIYDDSDSALFTKSFYVLTSTYRLYKCVWNNATLANPTGGVVANEPTSTSTNIFQTADGYRWKYMLTVPTADIVKFNSSNWIPLRILTADDSSGSNQWTVQQAAVTGTIDAIKVTNSGTSYTGTPTVSITGDGVGATATVHLSAGQIDKVLVDNPGSGYTYASITIGNPGGGSNAVLTPIISPVGGHGSNATAELGAFYTMTNVVMAYDEATDFTVENDFRKILLIKNPLAFGTTNVASASTMNASTKLVFTSVTGTFVVDEQVSNGTATANVVSYDSGTKTLIINNIIGTFATSDNVTGVTSSAVGTNVSSKVNPEYEAYSGDIVYKDYRKPISRATDQRESVSIIVSF
jgi:hypothetical protein